MPKPSASTHPKLVRSRAVRTKLAQPIRADVYDHPLWYDILQTPGTREEIASLTRIARRFLQRRAFKASDALWIEPACGSGRYLRALAKVGAQSLGVDLNAGMVRFAQRSFIAETLPAVLNRSAKRSSRALVPIALKGDMRTMDTPAILRAARSITLSDPGRPRIAFCTHNSFRHLRTDRDAIAHLQSTARLLQGGFYLVGIGLLGPGGEVACETVAIARRGGVCVREIVDFVPPETSTQIHVQSTRVEHAYRHLTVTARSEDGRINEREIISHYQLRTYTLEQWRGLLKRAGLRELGVCDAWGKPLPADRCSYAMRVVGV